MNLRTKIKQQIKHLKMEIKQLYGYFKLQYEEIANKLTWTWLRRGKLKRETKSFLIIAQNHLDIAKKEKAEERSWISFYWSTKSCQKN